MKGAKTTPNNEKAKTLLVEILGGQLDLSLNNEKKTSGCLNVENS